MLSWHKNRMRHVYVLSADTQVSCSIVHWPCNWNLAKPCQLIWHRFSKPGGTKLYVVVWTSSGPVSSHFLSGVYCIFPSMVSHDTWKVHVENSPIFVTEVTVLFKALRKMSIYPFHSCSWSISLSIFDVVEAETIHHTFVLWATVFRICCFASSFHVIISRANCNS